MEVITSTRSSQIGSTEVLLLVDVRGQSISGEFAPLSFQYGRGRPSGLDTAVGTSISGIGGGFGFSCGADSILSLVIRTPSASVSDSLHSFAWFGVFLCLVSFYIV